jgi:BirA family transcriptional regulator, biotin operon repressor / biotin---[acetyl-CoA-carboxylase] ligase
MKLTLSTRALARQLEVHDSILSTNVRAKELAHSSDADGLCVVAHAQSAGRGQRDRVWASPAGAGLYVSFLVRPNIHPKHTPMLTLATAIAVHEAMQDAAGIRAGIKWPNDILDPQSLKKLGGILVEASSSAAQLHHAVIGIGVNFKQDAFPGTLQSYATSLQALGANNLTPASLLSAIANSLEPKLDALTHGQIPSLLDAWRDRALGVGQTVQFIVDDTLIEGTLDGINATGALIIDGKAYYSGELRLPNAPLRPND